LVTGHAAADPRHGGVACDGEGRAREDRRAEPEATRIHVARGVAARTVAVEAADRDVVAVRRRRDHGDIDERPDTRTVTAQTPGHTLVGAGDGVEREVARRRMALRAHGGGWNVIAGLRGRGKQVRPKGRRGDVTVAAVA